MALEQVFKCPRTLNKLREGPLGELMDGFCTARARQPKKEYKLTYTYI
jgi:hypothetical protein